MPSGYNTFHQPKKKRGKNLISKHIIIITQLVVIMNTSKQYDYKHAEIRSTLYFKRIMNGRGEDGDIPG